MSERDSNDIQHAMDLYREFHHQADMVLAAGTLAALYDFTVWLDTNMEELHRAHKLEGQLAERLLEHVRGIHAVEEDATLLRYLRGRAEAAHIQILREMYGFDDNTSNDSDSDDDDDDGNDDIIFDPEFWEHLLHNIEVKIPPKKDKGT